MIARSKPAADTVAELVTADTGTSLFLTGWACNTGPEKSLITVYALSDGETAEDGRELYHDLVVPKNDTFSFTPIHLEDGESVHVKSSTGEVVFTVTGQRMAK